MARIDELAPTLVGGEAPPAASEALPAASEVPSGERPLLLGARYEIQALVGVGGMGSVYRARDTELDEIVALKTLRRELVDAPGSLERFRREVKLARRVTHVNVARTYDIGEHGGEKFLTMEYIDGESLGALLARERRLPLGRALAIADALVAGLGAAHAAGVVHRDLKPDNVILGRDGRVVITDFGIARPADMRGPPGNPVPPPAATRDEGAAALTGVAFIGTPAYMAPEQVVGEPVDARTDLYALGVMLFELVTGSQPFRGESQLAIAAARLLAAPPDPRSLAAVPDAVAGLVQRLMAIAPNERFASAADVAAALAAVTRPTLVAFLPAPAPAVAPLGDRPIAILPFKNAGQAADDGLAEGLTEDLVDALSMTRGLRVRPLAVATRALREAGGERDPRALGKVLGVEVVADGSVRKHGGAVRVSARLVSVDDGFQIWARRFDRSESELLLVNDEVARAIAEALTLERGGKGRQATDPAALDLYLRGRAEYRKFRMRSPTAALALLDQALARAPDDPTILAGWAMARAYHWFHTGEGGELVREAAERAVAIAPYLAEARFALATVNYQRLEHVATLRELQRALAMVPSLADAHLLFGRLLTETGPLDEAIARLSTAVTLDPTLDVALRDLGRAHALAGRWDETAAAFARISTDLEGRLLRLMAEVRLAMWRRDGEALKAFVLTVQGDPELTAGLPFVAKLIGALVLGGEPLTSAALSRGRPDGGPRSLCFRHQLQAEAAAYQGRYDEALEAMRAGSDAGLVDLMWLDHCQLFGPLRADERFVAVRRAVAERVAPILAELRSPA